jgi:hypothetical protein
MSVPITADIVCADVSAGDRRWRLSPRSFSVPMSVQAIVADVCHLGHFLSYIIVTISSIGERNQSTPKKPAIYLLITDKLDHI